MKCYLAGPMSGLPNYNAPAFVEAADRLRAMGHSVLSPVELDEVDGIDLDSKIEKDEYCRLLARDILLIAERGIEAIVLLKGWEKSKGVRVELAYAEACSLQRFTLEDKGLMPLARRENVLQEAQRLVLGNRGSTYGHPHTDFSRTAQMMSAVLGHEIRADQVPLLMICVKLSRLVNSPDHRDSMVDVGGYGLTWEMVRERMNEESFKCCHEPDKDFNGEWVCCKK